MKTIGLLVSIIIIINSCTNTIRQNEETQNEDIYINWQIDSLGCSGFRQNIIKFKFLILNKR